MGGAPKFEPSQSLPDVSYAELANAMGIPGIAIDRDDGIGPAWDRALTATGPPCWTFTATRRCHRYLHTPPTSRSKS